LNRNFADFPDPIDRKAVKSPRSLEDEDLSGRRAGFWNQLEQPLEGIDGHFLVLKGNGLRNLPETGGNRHDADNLVHVHAKASFRCFKTQKFDPMREGGHEVLPFFTGNREEAIATKKQEAYHGFGSIGDGLGARLKSTGKSGRKCL